MNKSRILAILMAVIIVTASLPGLTVQAAAIGKEAQACQTLEILIGEDASGVTSTYLAKTPTRIQAYIISLRLKGLYSEAGEYESNSNFTDAAAAGWARNYLAYARNNPELGWSGYPDGSFGVSDNINGQAFYKVMLETLGYRQGLDFTYAETLEFAEKKGLVADADEVAKIKSFTVNDIAKGIYSALNTKPADSDKKLISVMVENNIISSEKAISAGFTLDTKDAKVVAFNAVSNTKIEVEFDQEILLQKADVDITQLGGSSRLSVLSVESDGKKAVITTTEAKPFNAYELAINTLVPTNSMVVKDYKKKFVAMPKDTVKPTVKHELLGRNEILLSFDEVMDRSSAEDRSNYRIEYDVSVLSAELSSSGKSVLLKTTDMTKFYRLTVQNVCDSAGNSIDKYSVTFDGAGGDSQEPSITKVKSENNTTVTVLFNERVDESEATDVGNYDVDGLDVKAAVLDESGRLVTLTTGEQKSNTTYELTVSNIEDTWGNTMYRKKFGFVADNSRPSAVVVAISNNEVQVTFTKVMDKETAEDINNYSINNNLEVKDAFLDEEGKVVTLITSEQTLRTVYTVTVTQVYDAWGNMINTTTGKFGGMAEDTRALSYTAKSNGNEIIVTYNKRVDKEAAEDVFNYDLDDALGYAAKAELDDTGRTVTLLTADHSSGRMYTIEIENVKDIFGNEISTDSNVSTKKFAGVSGGGTGNGEGGLNLETVVSVNVNTIDLVFSDELTSDELEDLEIEVDVPGDYDYDVPSDLEYYKYFVGDEKNVRIQFRTDSSKNPKVFESGNIYEVEITELDRLNIKNDANVKLFAGTDTPNEAPEILEVEAINNTAVEVTFSEPVTGITKSQFEIKSSVNISGVSVEDDEEITDKVTLYISSSTELDDDDYRLYVKSGIKDAAGLNSVEIDNDSSSSYFEFEGTSDENEAPYVDSDINVIDSYTIQFEFNEEIGDITNSSFSVKRTSGSGSSINVSKALLSDDRKTVTLYFNSRYAGLDSDYEYELVINSSVEDLQGMDVDSDDRRVEFDGEDIELEELEIIASYIDSDNKEITLITNKELDISNLDIDDFEFDGAGYYGSSSDQVEFDENSITIILRNELDDNETLTIEISNTTRSKIKDYNNQELETEEVEIETK